MNFAELTEIIRYIIRFIPCASCNVPYKRNELLVLATIPNECMLGVRCIPCGSQALLSVAITRGNGNGQEKYIDVRRKETGKISENDILDLKNFLKTFEGDFKEIFK